ncbi:unnamed protein product [Sphagnum jensenii]|uniref:Uncharacterized protein n=1 Tax=Sphagnum jensenii TaxID=128206 RepID=A0ABP0XM42_9BRYO
MAHMWEFGGRITKTCSPKTKMAMFGHRFYYNNCVPASQRSKESLLAHTTEDLKAYTNAWADKFVDTNLRPHLASWLLQLEDAYPEELPKLKAHLRKTPFTTMGTTYVKKQDRIEQMGDMLDSAMRQANVARRRKITAPLPGDSKNAPPRKEGRRQLDGVLHIKFSPASIEQCEGED